MEDDYLINDVIIIGTVEVIFILYMVFKIYKIKDKSK